MWDISGTSDCFTPRVGCLSKEVNKTAFHLQVVSKFPVLNCSTLALFVTLRIWFGSQ